MGSGPRGPISEMLSRRVILGLRESATPFTLTWDRDVADRIVEGALGDATGIYNLVGEGVVTLREMAKALGRPYLALPAALLERALATLHPRGLSKHGPEVVAFLRHRPVMSGERLRQHPGFGPLRTTRETLEVFRAG